MKTNGPVLIIGAGIGGLTLAIALRRAGFAVEVYERAPALREVGAAISIMPNATRVLRHLEVLDPLLACGSTLKTGCFYRDDGQVLRMASNLEFDTPGLCLHRADLQHSLYGQLPEGTVKLSHELVDFAQQADGVTARFANGAQAVGSLLVGADGLRSVVRQKLIGDGPPVYRGYQCWRGVNPSIHAEVLSETLGPGRRFGIVPMGPRGTAWWAVADEPEDCVDAPGETRRKLSGLFGTWHSPIPDLISSTPEGSFFKNAIYDRPPIKEWHRGRVVLMGDAAHPTTPNLGQGGGMAIEDALLLARCLDRFPDCETAFQRFSDLRRPRTSHIVQQSLNWGRMGQWRNPLLRAGRNALLRWLPEASMARNILDLMSYDPTKVDLDSQ